MESGNLAAHSIEITGAGSGVGKALAMQFKDNKGVSMRLIGGRRKDELQRTHQETNACGHSAGDIFDPTSEPYNRIMFSCADVIAHIAAINLDTHEDQSQRDPLRVQQNTFLERLIEGMKSFTPSNPRLLLVVNSVTAFFARELPKAAALPYMRMKMEQADILSAARVDLDAAGIQLSVVYPGAIRTEMMKHLPDDDKAVRMANMFGSRLKRVPGREAGLVQDHIFQPQEIAEALAKLVNYFFVNGTIPESSKDWIMANHADMVLPELEAVR